MDINDRIIKLIDELGISQNAFAKALDTSSSRISNITTKRNKPDSEILAKICEVFTNVNSSWLLTGNGSMFTDGLFDGVQRGMRKFFAGMIEPYDVILEPIFEKHHSIKDEEVIKKKLLNEFKKNKIVARQIEKGLLDEETIAFIISHFLDRMS